MHARLATVKPQPVQLSKNPFPQESLRQRNKTMGDDGRTFTQELREKNNGEDGEFGNGRDGGRNPGNLAVTFFDACRLGGVGWPDLFGMMEGATASTRRGQAAKT